MYIEVLQLLRHLTAHVNIFATVTSSTATKITKKLRLIVCRLVAIAEDTVL